jgi:hypothetical protein
MRLGGRSRNDSAGGASVRGGWRLGVSCGGLVGVEALGGVFVEELAGDVGPELVEGEAYGSGEHDDQGIGNCLRAAVGAVWVVKVGECAGGEDAADPGVVRLPFAGVVVFADDDAGEGIEQAAGERAVAEAEVARILVENGGQDGLADHGAANGVEVRNADAVQVAHGTPSECGVAVVRFAEAGDDKGSGEGDGVSYAAEGEAEFLFGGEGDGVGDVGDVELREDAEDALLLLLVDLLIGLIVAGRGGSVLRGRRLRGLSCGGRVGEGFRRDKREGLGYAGKEGELRGQRRTVQGACDECGENELSKSAAGF